MRKKIPGCNLLISFAVLVSIVFFAAQNACAALYRANVTCTSTAVVTVPAGKTFKVYSLIITNNFDTANNPLVWLERNTKDETNPIKVSYNSSLQVNFTPPVVYTAGQVVGVSSNHCSSSDMFITINGQMQ